MEKIIHVAIIDDSVAIRLGLRLLIARLPGIEIVGDGGYSAASMLANRGPHVLLFRIEQNETGCVRACLTNLLRDCPGLRILILAHGKDDPNIGWALEKGARGCLLKESSLDDMEAAIREVAKGNIYLPAVLLRAGDRARLDHMLESKVERTIHLPVQQLRVLKLISQGYSNSQIAQSLVISKRTVEMHTYRLFKRLNVSCRTQAVQVALRTGLIELQDLPDGQEWKGSVQH